MLKSQPLNRYSFKSVPSALDVPGGVAEDEAPDMLSGPDAEPAQGESPTRRAHRLRMKAFLAAARLEN